MTLSPPPIVSQAGFYLSKLPRLLESEVEKPLLLPVSSAHYTQQPLYPLRVVGLNYG